MKHLKIVFMFIIVFSLTACGEKNLICKKTNMKNGTTTNEIVKIVSKKNKPIETNLKIKMEFNNNMDSQITLAYNNYEKLYNKFKNIDGVDIKYNKDNNILTFEMSVNFKKVKKDENLGLDFSKTDNIEKITSSFEEDGYSCE